MQGTPPDYSSDSSGPPPAHVRIIPERNIISIICLVLELTMAFLDYLWIVRLLIELLRILAGLSPEERASISESIKDLTA